MTLLNHLVGNKTAIAKEFVMDDKKRMALWQKHLANFSKREELSKRFNFANVDNLVKDFNATSEVLTQIEQLISPELIHIDEEEKTDQEILMDLERLKSNHELDSLTAEVVNIKQKEKLLLALFKELHDVLKAELHLIRLIKKHPVNTKELLLKLFEFIFHREARLNKVFFKENYFVENKYLHASVTKIARAIILGQELKEELETDEEKFARTMLQKMVPGESKGTYRKLGEDIYLNLVEMSGAPVSKAVEMLKAITGFENLMKNDKIMFVVVKRLRPRYDDVKVRAAIIAFRQAYNFGHFSELESEFLA